MKKKLGNKILAGCLIFALIIVGVTSTILGHKYISHKTGEYEELLYSYVESAADYIDGDSIARYVETQEPDAYYDSIMDFFNSTLAHSDILYYYVFVPFDQDLMYIWDADATDSSAEGNTQELGYREPYMEGGREDLEMFFRKDPVKMMTTYDDPVYGNIACAYYPIFDSTGEPVAIVGVDLSVKDMRSSMISFVATAVVAILLITLAATIVLYLAIQRGVAAPIKRLNDASRELVKNLDSDQPFQVDIHTGDEIEELATSFASMNMEVKDYIHRLAAITTEKERIGAELNIATHIQSSMLPSIFPAFPERQEFDIFATMDPAKEVGGDFYDFFMVDEQNLAVVIADVSGKGVPAALFMVIAKTLIKDHTIPGEDLGEVFRKVNDLLCESNSEGFFVTAFEGVLNLVTGEFRFVNAGHEIPFICRKGGLYEPHPVKAGFVLAGLDGVNYKSGSIMLEPGDKLFQYTDGVPEATDANFELYGMERLEAFLKQHSDVSPSQLLPLVKADVDRFVGEADQFDDLTMLCVEYKQRMELPR